MSAVVAGMARIFTGAAAFPSPTMKLCHLLLPCLVLLAAASLAAPASADAIPQAVQSAPLGRVLRVGPAQELRTIAAASRVAQDGDIIEVEAGAGAGDYVADVAVWTQDRLTLRGVGGRARLVAAGANAEGKALWVMRGDRILVENFEFTGARVPHKNGAGIRLEKGRLTVRNCLFLDNQNGILTSNLPEVELTVEDSEFSGPRTEEPGIYHNLYAGTIRRLVVTGSYSHHARTGHLLKSRAAENFILYNRLTDETGGRASYELDLPNGGVAYVIGNIIRQGVQTENPHLIAFGAEGYKWPRNELYLAHNTLVDDLRGGIFLRVREGANRVTAVNNLLLGNGALEVFDGGEYRHNPRVGRGDVAVLDAQDFRPRASARLAGRLAEAVAANGAKLTPEREYVHPRQTRALAAPATLPGAVQTVAP